MSRTKLTAYVAPNLADALQRAAAIEDRSTSDLIEDAIARFFERHNGEGEHHAVMALLNQIDGQLSVVERNHEMLFELTCHAARFAMSTAPTLSERDFAAHHARGGEHFRNVLADVITRLTSGKSIWREHFAHLLTPKSNTSH